MGNSVATSIAEVKKPKAQKALEKYAVAFEKQDVDKLVGGFSEDCVVVLASKDGKHNEYTGREGAREAFSGVLGNLKGALELEVLDGSYESRSGVMVWRGKSPRYDYRSATNTVVVDKRGRITHFHMFYDGGQPSVVDRAKVAREWCK